MFNRYFQYFKKRVSLNDDEQEFIKNYLFVKKLRKRQYLLQEGDVCNFVSFVEKGALRLYRVSEDGKENILLFALDEMFMSDLYSFLTNEPTTFNIDAIEDSELVMITRTASEELRKLSPKYQEFIFQETTDAYIQMERRINSTICLNPEERYVELTSNYPNILQRLPQHMIASYMGLTPETLSRVRKRISIRR